MAVTDQDGKVKYSYNYTPYGELLEGEYSDTVPFLYNGQFGVTTDGNGLYYMRARYYNVDIKRFINQDVLMGTLERISSLNRYAYVEGNPVSFLDPFGLEKSIYDEWHEVLQTAESVYNKLSLLATILGYIFPPSKEIVEPVVWMETFIIYCVDFGTCIGRAWEGIYENDYNKVDSSYERMKEIGQSILLMLGTSILDSLYDKTVYGFINDIIGLLQDL